MTNYRRSKFEGGFFFFTVVTYKRQKIFLNDVARQNLRDAFKQTRAKRAFSIMALCLLPDHLHCVWKLPQGDNNYSLRWAMIKSSFSRSYGNIAQPDISQSVSRNKKREKNIWQRRFWEHQIIDEKDLQNHVDYIHFNPVKHELVEDVRSWPWSTYHKYVKTGFYKDIKISQLQDELENVIAGE